MQAPVWCRGYCCFATIYWQTKVFETKRIGAFVVMEAGAISQGSDDQILWSVRSRTTLKAPDEYNDMIFAALFTPDRRPLAGNLEQLPADLQADGGAHESNSRRRGGTRGSATNYRRSARIG